MSLLSIDVGGTTVKYALFNQGQLTEHGKFATPDNLADFYENLTQIAHSYQEKFSVTGVAMSCPGAVNKVTGVIEGASALPYIHNFDIHSQFEQRFALPVSIENDANCAALAEVKFGAAQGLSNVLFVVLGTGVGGAVVSNGQIHHGKHLFGGEFGFMLMDDEHSFSELGTTVRMAERYNRRTNQALDAVEIFDKAFAGDKIAQEEMDIFTFNVAKGIYNLQYSFDPDRIVIGGGVSQADWLLPELNKQMQKIIDKLKIGTFSAFLPEIAVCHYRNEANLIGAAVDFEQTFSK